jgi:hypothetical protein
MKIVVGACVVAVLCGAFALVAGCGSDGSSSETTVRPDDAGQDTTPPAATGTLSVLVVAPNLLPNSPRKDIPVAGAVVGLDKPGGEHVESTADASGKVTFTGIDWSSGTASVVGYKEGLSAYGVSDVGPASFKSIPNGPNEGAADVVLYLFPATSQLPVALTVTFQNKAASGNGVVDGATTGGGSNETKSGFGRISILPGAPYSLVTREYSLGTAASAREIASTTVRWAQFDEPAATGPAAGVSIDLAAGGVALTPTTTHGRVTIPGGETGPLAGSRLTASATSLESNLGALVGSLTTSTLTADKSSYDIAFETNTFAGQTTISNFVLTRPDQSLSQITLLGALAEGQTIDRFLTPVPITTSTQSLADPVDLTGAAADTVTRFIVLDAFNGTLLIVDAPPSTKALHLPKLPAAAKAVVKKGASSAAVYSLADNDVATFIYLRAAGSRPLSVTVP